MNKRGLLKITGVVIVIAFFFLALVWLFPVNPEDISGNLVKRDIINEIKPKVNTKTNENSITVEIKTGEKSICKFSKMKLGGYYLPYKKFENTSNYYHKTKLLLDKGRNNFKFHCKELNSKRYDSNYWSIIRE